jgi:hypothetical protein
MTRELGDGRERARSGAVVGVEDPCEEAADAVLPGGEDDDGDDGRERNGVERERDEERRESAGGVENAGGESDAESRAEHDGELGDAAGGAE